MRFKLPAEKLAKIAAQALPKEMPQEQKAPAKTNKPQQPKFVKEKDGDKDKITYDVGFSRSKSYTALSNIVKHHKDDLRSAELWHMPGQIKNISDDYGFVVHTKESATEFTVKFLGDADFAMAGSAGGAMPKEVASAKQMLESAGCTVVEKKMPATIEGQREWNKKFHEVEKMRGKRKYNERADKEKTAALVTKIVALADELDKRGFEKEAAFLDSLIQKL